MKSNLLDDAVVTELTRVRKINDVIAVLEKTVYKPELVEASKEFDGVSIIDEALHRNLAKTIRKVWEILPPSEKNNLEVFTAEWDAENFKKILSKKELGQKIGEKDVVIVCPAREPLLKQMSEAHSAREAAKALSGGWGSLTFKIAVNAAAAEHKFDFRKVIREIDKERLRQLNSLTTISDPLAQKIVRDILEFQAVMLTLRLKKERSWKGAEKEQARALGATEFFQYANGRARRIGEAGDLSNAVAQAAEEYGLKQDPDELAEKPLSALEIILEKKLVERILRSTRLSVLSFAAIMGFLYLKMVEVGNLRKISFAIAFDLKEEMSAFVYAVNPAE
jgi:vacuolar-type H+-ATPase subunit C/Vma6